MSKAQIMEAEFESNICEGLGAAGWLYSGSAAVDPEWDPALALYNADLLWWLANRYPEQYENAVPDTLVGATRQQAELLLLRRMAAVLATRACLPKIWVDGRDC